MWIRRRRSKSLLLASLLTLVVMAVASFATTAGAAAMRQPYAPAGATGTGADAPPVGSQPFNAKLWDAHNYSIVHHAVSCPQSPASVTARLALVNSPTVLTYFGLPTLALESGNLTKWQHIVSGMQTHQCDDTVYVKNGQPIRNFGNSDNRKWGGWGSN